MTAAATAFSPDPSLPARERILLAAHELFYRDGLRATGVDRVIAAAGVTKVTFYRHFPAKDELIRAFLAYRHERWMAWFQATLARHQAAQSPTDRLQKPLQPLAVAHRRRPRRRRLQPLAVALGEWLREPGFRGCAFINAVAELGGGLGDALAIAAAHKQDMVGAIETLLQGRPESRALAEAAGLAADGAIVRAQTGGAAVDQALAGLERVLTALTPA